nr:retrovirus-related Pol polyprotein from transposon gypsy [Tanacetum cinerariifolium]
MEEDYKLAVHNQRRVNPKIHDVIPKEVEKLLDAGLIYQIFYSPWVSPMLERLAGNGYYCFLDDFSGYFQIPIDPRDQEKTMFTCPYGTFAYRRMPFGLCNAPGTFQRGLSDGITMGSDSVGTSGSDGDGSSCCDDCESSEVGMGWDSVSVPEPSPCGTSIESKRGTILPEKLGLFTRKV